MKHLKLFEDREDKLFWGITEDEYEDNIEFGEKLTDGELDNLEKILTQEELSYGIYIDEERPFLEYSISIDVCDYLHDIISLYKLEDDWFYVSSAFFYKCDQWDGLLECLKYIIKNEIRQLIKHYLYNDPVYEEYREEKLFWEIDDKRFCQRVWGGDSATNPQIENLWVNFTDKELNKLSELLPDIRFRKDLWAGGKEIPVPKNLQKAQILIQNRNMLLITKTIDEWFYVYSIGFVTEITPGKIYQCDEFNGLIACLEYLKKEERT